MKKNIRIILPSFLLLVFSFCLTYVYAAFNASMTIDGIANVEKVEVAIVGTEFKSTSGVSADYDKPRYTFDTITYPVSLGTNSSITFDLKIYNTQKEQYEITDMEVTKNNLTVEYSSGCFYADVLDGQNYSNCTVKISNNTSYFVTESVTTKFTFEPYVDQTLNHKIETLAKGISNGIVNTLADDRSAINHEITYIGKDPNNYLTLHGRLFRIVGLDTAVDDGSGNIETRAKIVTESSIDGKYLYSKYDTNINGGRGIADYASSELQQMLNGIFYESGSGTCYQTDSNATASTCDFTTTGGLGSTPFVKEAVWHYGVYAAAGGNPTQMYEGLLGSQSYQAGGCPTFVILNNNRYCKSPGTGGTTYTAKVGLLSPSDFGFASSGGTSKTRDECLTTTLSSSDWSTTGACGSTSWLNDNKGAQWVIQPAIASNSYGRMFTWKEKIDDQNSTKAFRVRPVLYLKTDTVVYGGTGTKEDPYIVDPNDADNIFRVTFDPNGGSGELGPQIFVSGKVKNLYANTFTYEGHSFMGWSKNSAATTPEYTDKQMMNITEDTVLYAIWSEDEMLYDRIKQASLGVSAGNYKAAVTEKGVYEYTGNDSDGGSDTIYYYRGLVNDNNILFANLCWKIMRTTSTGGIKLLYNGTYNSSTGCSGNRTGVSKVMYNNFTTLDSAGYMYESGKLHGYATDSLVKAAIQRFYVNNLAGYTSYLEDVPFCNNRTLKNENGRTLTSEVSLEADVDFTHSSITKPTLECDGIADNFNVGYQVTRISQGNQALTLPIGLPTADEMVFAGSDNESYEHNYSYINWGDAFWTMTPKRYEISKSSVTVWRVDSTGKIGSVPTTNAVNIRPVVSLSDQTVYLSGDGTAMDPIVIQEPKQVQYGLTYYANGGTGEMPYRFVSKGEEITLLANAFTRPGYHFLGWATTDNNEVVYQDKEIVTLTKDTMLYAVWERDSVSFDYTGTIQAYTVPKTGLYRLETWGAQGGNVDSTYQGGYGAYATGFANLVEGETIYIVVGGQGQLGSKIGETYVAGGYNGGGFGYNRWTGIAVTSGGGATHIAKSSGLVFELGSNVGDILMISGGGAGAYNYENNFWSGNSAGGIRGGYSNAHTKFNAGYLTATYTETDENGVETEYTAGFDYGHGGLRDDTGFDRNDNQSGGGAGWRGGLSDYGERGAGGGSSFYTSVLLSHDSIDPHFAVLANTSYSVADNLAGQGTNYQMDTSYYEAARTFIAEGVSEAPLTDYAKKGNGFAKITYYG